MGRLTREIEKKMQKVAAEIRQNVVKTVHGAGAGHLGGPLSATDILTALYFDVMNIKPDFPEWQDRDRFVLSKGHSAIALYCTLAERGYFPKEELHTFDEIDSRLQAHPDMKLLPGLDMSTGSLGQGISAAVGMALGAKLKQQPFRTYCMVGDGESQEGQVWEAVDTAVKYKLDNLTVILDNNNLQQYGWKGTEGRTREIPVFNPGLRWETFGFHVIEIDGHDFEQIVSALREAETVVDKPTVIVAHTVKGKGVDYMENNYLWHSKIPTDQELAQALSELQGGIRQ